MGGAQADSCDRILQLSSSSDQTVAHHASAWPDSKVPRPNRCPVASLPLRRQMNGKPHTTAAMMMMKKIEAATTCRHTLEQEEGGTG